MICRANTADGSPPETSPLTATISAPARRTAASTPSETARSRASLSRLYTISAQPRRRAATASPSARSDASTVPDVARSEKTAATSQPRAAAKSLQHRSCASHDLHAAAPGRGENRVYIIARLSTPPLTRAPSPTLFASPAFRALTCASARASRRLRSHSVNSSVLPSQHQVLYHFNPPEVNGAAHKSYTESMQDLRRTCITGARRAPSTAVYSRNSRLFSAVLGCNPDTSSFRQTKVCGNHEKRHFSRN